MRIVVFGAAGGTGREVVHQALAAGHEVTAFVRRPSAFEVAHERLRIVAGDAFNRAAVATGVAGNDAVVSALGTRPWRHRDICSGGTRNVVLEMQEHGVRRLVVMSSLGVAESRAWLGILGRVGALVLRRSFADKAVMEQIVRESGLDWVIARPAMLTNGRRRGRIRVAIDGSIRGGFISRADVAAFLLEQVANDRYVGQSPVVST